MAHFAARVKDGVDIDACELVSFGQTVADEVRALRHERVLENDSVDVGISVFSEGLRSLSAEKSRLLIKDSISPLPLHKVLTLLDRIKEQKATVFQDHAKLALAKQTVNEISNLRFGPEIGVGKKKYDSPVLQPWLDALATW